MINSVNSEVLGYFNTVCFRYFNDTQKLKIKLECFKYKKLLYQRINSIKEKISEIVFDNIDRFGRKLYFNRDEFLEILDLCKKRGVTSINFPVNFSISTNDFDDYYAFKSLIIIGSSQNNIVAIDCDKFKLLENIGFESCKIEVTNLPENINISISKINNNFINLGNVRKIRSLNLIKCEDFKIKSNSFSKLQIDEIYIDNAFSLELPTNLDLIEIKSIKIVDSSLEFLSFNFLKSLNRNVSILIKGGGPIKSVKGLEKVKEVLLENVLIEDLDTEPLIECERVFFTSKKGYNYSFKDVEKLKKHSL